MRRIKFSEFENLFLKKTHLIDVRSPVEFADGAIPNAINLPLLSDTERHEVGIAFKNHGQAAAVELGHQLVKGTIKEIRVARWIAELEAHPGSVIYCFRGGLRSQIVQSWLQEAGHERPVVDGGYKALRHYLIETLEGSLNSIEFQVVSGPTGSGKTDFLKSSALAYIDLEGLANHRGSAFGSLSERQPSQINFENELAVALLSCAQCDQAILIEDESQQIGHRLIPGNLFRKMQISRKIILDVPLETRVENIFKDYVLNSSLGNAGDLEKFSAFRAAVRAISRKLGGTRTTEILSDLNQCETLFVEGKGLDSNRVWIRKLLEWYYDPYYKFALERNSKP